MQAGLSWKNERVKEKLHGAFQLEQIDHLVMDELIRYRPYVETVDQFHVKTSRSKFIAQHRPGTFTRTYISLLTLEWQNFNSILVGELNLHEIPRTQFMILTDKSAPRTAKTVDAVRMYMRASILEDLNRHRSR
jgi:hypothetical protein